jgi:hypothetical protein
MIAFVLKLERQLGSVLRWQNVMGEIGQRRVALISCILALSGSGVISALSATSGNSLQDGYSEMYNLEFEPAHRSFHAYEVAHPEDPLGPVSDAAAYLFSEFDRLHILQSEFFLDDDRFFRRHAPAPDQAVKRNFENALSQTEHIVSRILAQSPDDESALFASVLRLGLDADYLALIEKRNLAALSEIKQSQGVAAHLLAKHPDCYDAYVSSGVENYLLSLKPAPVRWLLRVGGAQADKEVGIANLRLTAEKGHYLKPYARLLLAVAALRDNDRVTAKKILSWLTSEFPQNRLYREELQKLS